VTPTTPTPTEGQEQKKAKPAQEPKRLENGRLIGGYSLHDAVDPNACLRGHEGSWRCVDCEDLAGPGRDIVECSRCGAQKTVRCDFDDEYR
jgi:hypothetical protein